MMVEGAKDGQGSVSGRGSWNCSCNSCKNDSNTTEKQNELKCEYVNGNGIICYGGAEK